jgi:dihydrodipicolinate synthase/N-acetylneuraminate lyase
MPRQTPRDYEKKFAGFIRLCQEARVSGVKQVVVATPSVIGDTRDEMVESLSRLAEAGLTLQVAQPEPPARDTSRN